MLKGKQVSVYQGCMITFSLLIIVMTFIQLIFSLTMEWIRIFYVVDVLIWLFFVGEYSILLVRSESKWMFIKTHKIDLIPMIPFFSFFRLFRMIHLMNFLPLLHFFDMLKVTGLIGVFAKHMGAFVRVNRFNYILVITLVVIFLGSGGLMWAEGVTFLDALWWSLVTMTTVGYGDIIPQTGIGRLLASLMMLTGVGFFGILAGTISTYFFTRQLKQMQRSSTVAILVDRLHEFDTLSYEEVKEITSILEGIKHHESEISSRE